MRYINALIPLMDSIVCILVPQTILKPADKLDIKKKATIKKVGYVLLAVTIVYFIADNFKQLTYQ